MSQKLKRDREELSDAGLLQAYREGNNQAAGELYKRYYLKLVRGISLKLPSVEVAEDCVNAAFYKVLDIIKRGKGPSANFYGYLRSAVVRESIDFYKGRNSEVQFNDFVDHIDEQVSLSDEYIQIDEHDIQAALQSLPENWGRLLNLRYVENQKPADMAKLLKTEVSALRKMLYRAKNGLRDAYFRQVVISRSVGACRKYSSDIVDYVTGRPKMSETRADELQAHLSTCSECFNTQAELTHQWRRVSPEALGLALLIGGSVATWCVSTGSAGAAADTLATGVATQSKSGAASQTAFGTASKTITIGGVSQTASVVVGSSLIAFIAAGVMAAAWLQPTPAPVATPAPTVSSGAEPHKQTVSTADGYCELNVSTANGKLQAEATVHEGECWFTYQRVGAAPRNEVSLHTGWLLLTQVSGTYDLKLRSEQETTQLKVTI